MLVTLTTHLECSRVQADTTQDIFLQMIPDAISFITEALEKGKILVHCDDGLNRSAICVCAYLMAARRISVQEALSELKTRRPAVNPSFEFLQILGKVYEGQLQLSHAVDVPPPPSTRNSVPPTTRKPKKFVSQEPHYVECPNADCGMMIEIAANEIRCGTFRCGKHVAAGCILSKRMRCRCLQEEHETHTSALIT